MEGEEDGSKERLSREGRGWGNGDQRHRKQKRDERSSDFNEGRFLHCPWGIETP